LTDDDTALGHRSEASTQSLTLTHGGDSRTLPCLGAHHRQRPHRVGATNAVSSSSTVRLKLLERTCRPWAEDPIDPATVEPEATQAGLQVGNVVAAQVR
jgi:hypothetical protein